MIEKLSDQMMREIAWEHYFGAKNRAIAKDGMRLARDYYDAQIDKQAKTINEMYDLYLENRPDQKIFEYATDSGLDEESGWSFAEAIALFIAAGGTIKDGE